MQNSAALDATYHYYYNSQQMVETRNGSDLTIKQNVWGLTYIDELVQTSLNDDPADLTEQVCESNYYAMQDANYNVLGMIDATGILVERYEYTPYGQRQTYTSSGLNDPLCYAPISTSKPWQIAGTPGIAQPYSLNETGHQGLYHDEELSPKHIENRARYRTDRWLQREPLGYPDGMSLYTYYAGMLGRRDPSGLQKNRSSSIGPSSSLWDMPTRQRAINSVKSQLKGLCREGCLGECPDESCSKEKCEEEAKNIAEKYVDAVRINRRCVSSWVGDTSGGHLCYEWRTIVHTALQGNNYSCFKISIGAEWANKRPWENIVLGQGSEWGVWHNWVNVTVGPQPDAATQSQPNPNCTKILDPWSGGGSPNLYDPSNYGPWSNQLILEPAPNVPGYWSGPYARPEGAGGGPVIID